MKIERSAPVRGARKAAGAYAKAAAAARLSEPDELVPASVLGILSLIVWSLVLIVSVKYLVVILRADLHGEGGILALTTLVCSKRTKLPSNKWLLPLGAALLAAGFSQAETGQILGGNYRRVFEASVI